MVAVFQWAGCGEWIEDAKVQESPKAKATMVLPRLPVAPSTRASSSASRSSVLVGTAGAVRYPLPPDSSKAKMAETNVYGYMLATVQPDGQIEFQFQRLNENEVPASVVQRYTPEFVHWCFAANSTTPRATAPRGTRSSENW